MTFDMSIRRNLMYDIEQLGGMAVSISDIADRGVPMDLGQRKQMYQAAYHMMRRVQRQMFDVSVQSELMHDEIALLLEHSDRMFKMVYWMNRWSNGHIAHARMMHYVESIVLHTPHISDMLDKYPINTRYAKEA